MANSIEQLLAELAHRSTLQVTTFGRKTGKRHTRTVWFLVEGANVYLVTLNLRRDWPRNVMKNRRVELDIGGSHFSGTATLIQSRRRFERVKRLLRSKYWAAWIGSWFGLEPEGAFEVSLQGRSRRTKPSRRSGRKVRAAGGKRAGSVGGPTLRGSR